MSSHIFTNGSSGPKTFRGFGETQYTENERIILSLHHRVSQEQNFPTKRYKFVFFSNVTYHTYRMPN